MLFENKPPVYSKKFFIPDSNFFTCFVFLSYPRQMRKTRRQKIVFARALCNVYILLEQRHRWCKMRSGIYFTVECLNFCVLQIICIRWLLMEVSRRDGQYSGHALKVLKTPDLIKQIFLPFKKWKYLYHIQKFLLLELIFKT